MARRNVFPYEVEIEPADGWSADSDNWAVKTTIMARVEFHRVLGCRMAANDVINCGGTLRHNWPRADLRRRALTWGTFDNITCMIEQLVAEGRF